MSSVSILGAITMLWVVVMALYFALFLYRSLVGMREEDSIYLSAGESRMAAEQHELMKRITKLDSYARWIGWTALALTLVVACGWGYDATRQLF
jgi:hypothetical protein